MTDTAVMRQPKEKPPGYVFGRPAVYRAEFCERIIEMGKRGLSQAQMGAELGVAKATITRWSDEHEDFRNALALARTYSQAVWETRADGGLENRDFNAGLWMKRVGSMFRDDYTEKVINEQTGTVRIEWGKTE